MSSVEAVIKSSWKIEAGATTLLLPNRLVMAPMTRRQAFKDNEPVEAHAKYYASRATGGLGLLITEGVHVNNTTSVDAPNTPQCRTQGQIAGWRAVADAVHATGSKIAMQLWHTGILSQQPVGPSALAFKPEVKALEEAELESIAQDFAATAAGAKEAGFDAVELHGGHGYLLDSFVSRALNQRTDAYGGERRAAFPALVVKAIRAAVGPDFPIIYRFSQWTIIDYKETKFQTSAELAGFLAELVEAGVNAFDASTRKLLAPAFPDEHPSRTLAGWTQALSGKPTMAVGGVGVTRDVVTGMNTSEFASVDPTAELQLIASGDVVALGVGRMALTNKDYGLLLQRPDGWKDAKPYDAERAGVFGVSPLDW